jgi:hypothetical protein
MKVAYCLIRWHIQAPAPNSPSRAERSGSGGFPAPAIVVFADDCFAVTCHTVHAVVSIAAIFARLIAVPAVG